MIEPLLLFVIVLLLVIPFGPIANRVPPVATPLFTTVDADVVRGVVVRVALLFATATAGFDATVGDGMNEDDTVGVSVPVLPLTSVLPFATGSGPLLTIAVEPVFVAPPAPAAN